MLARRLRRWANISPPLGQRAVFAVVGSQAIYVDTEWLLAPVAETGFSHRLTAYKIVGHFFGLSYISEL